MCGVTAGAGGGAVPSAVPPATAHAASQRAVGSVSVPSSTLVRVRGSLTTLFLKNDDNDVFEK